MVGIREKRGQSLVKVCQTWSNLIDGFETTGLGETRFMGSFLVDYWVLELLLENINEKIILKDDEHHVNIDLGNLIRQNDEKIYYFDSYIMYYHFYYFEYVCYKYILI